MYFSGRFRVIEAMASGMVTIVTDYGAPGELVANGRGIAVALAPLEDLVDGFRSAMERCVSVPKAQEALATKGHNYAAKMYSWDTKAAYTLRIYEAVLARAPLDPFTDYK